MTDNPTLPPGARLDGQPITDEELVAFFDAPIVPEPAEPPPDDDPRTVIPPSLTPDGPPDASQPEQAPEPAELPAVPSATNAKEPQAEADLCGAVIFDPEAYKIAKARGLTSAQFYTHVYRFIWRAYEKIDDGSFVITPEAVRDELDRADHADVDLAGVFTPTALNAARDADLVMNAAAVRQWQAKAEKEAQRSHTKGAVIPPEYLPATVRDTWELYTLANAYEDREPLQFIVDGIIQAESLTIPYGAPGSLKSLLFADMLVCVSVGIDYLPPAPWMNGNKAQPIKTRQCPVMWLDFDNGRRQTHDRFKALAKARKLPTDAPLFYYSMPAPWLASDRLAEMDRLTRRVKERKIELLAVDNLTLIKGDADINTADMALVMSLWRRLVDETGTATKIIHHQRKNSGQITREGENISGHNSIEAALDLGLLVSREENSDIVTVKSVKTRSADVIPFSAAWTYTHKPGSTELETAMFYGVTADDLRSNSALEREIISAAIMLKNANKTDLTKTVREALKDDRGQMPGVNRVRDYIERMAAAGKLKTTAGPRTEKLYSANETYRLTETYGDLRKPET